MSVDLLGILAPFAEFGESFDVEPPPGRSVAGVDLLDVVSPFAGFGGPDPSSQPGAQPGIDILRINTSFGEFGGSTTTTPLGHLSLGTLVVDTIRWVSVAISIAVGGPSGGTAPYLIDFQVAPDVGGAPGMWDTFQSGLWTSAVARRLHPDDDYWFRAAVTDQGGLGQSATTQAVKVRTAVAPVAGRYWVVRRA